MPHTRYKSDFKKKPCIICTGGMCQEYFRYDTQCRAQSRCHATTNLANSGAGSPNVGGISWLDSGTATESPPPIDEVFLLRGKT